MDRRICPKCHGYGWISEVSETVNGEIIRETITCYVCHGQGSLI